MLTFIALPFANVRGEGIGIARNTNGKAAVVGSNGLGGVGNHPIHTTFESSVDGLSFSESSKLYSICDGGDLGFGDGVSLFRADDSISGVPEGFSICRFENSACNGLALDTPTGDGDGGGGDDPGQPSNGGKNPLQNFPVAPFALDKVRAVEAMVSASEFDGGGAFCQVFGAAERRSDDHSFSAGLHGRKFGAALGYAIKLETLRSTVTARVFAAAANGKLADGSKIQLDATRRDFAFGAATKWIAPCISGLTTYATADLAVSFGRARCRIGDAPGNFFELDRIRDGGVTVKLALDQGVSNCGGGEFGVFGGVCYNHLRQDGFRGIAGKSWASIGSIDHNFLTTELGISANTFRWNNVTVSVKIGWRCAVARKHSAAQLRHGNGTSSQSELYYGSRHCAIGQLNSTYALSDDWNCRLGLDGDFSKNRRGIGVVIAFGRKI